CWKRSRPRTRRSCSAWPSRNGSGWSLTRPTPGSTTPRSRDRSGGLGYATGRGSAPARRRGRDDWHQRLGSGVHA
ncbi:Mobile element protein, partial [Arthrobacter sp. DR-2P]